MPKRKEIKHKTVSFSWPEFGYRIAIFTLNLFIFNRLVSSAMGFSRTWTVIYDQTGSHIIILLYTVSFFVLFRNFALLAKKINSGFEQMKPTFSQVLSASVLLLLSLMLIQVLSEFMVTTSFSP